MLRKYMALLHAAWSLMVEYRAEIVLWMMSSVWVVVMMLVWMGVSGDGSVNGFTAADYASYYIVTLFVRNMTASWASWELNAQIRQGTLSPRLLRPLHPVHYEITANLAEKVIRAFVVLPVMAIILLSTPHSALDLRPATLAIFALTVAGAWLISFFADYLIGTLSFWTSQATAFVEVFYALRMMLGGVLAPLQMFPEALQAVLRWLPFRYMMSFSSEVLTGRLAFDDLLPGLAVQWTWVAVLVTATLLLWRRAMRSYSAVGA